MPVRRGHVAPQNTFLDTIIRKFEGQSKYKDPLTVLFVRKVDYQINKVMIITHSGCPNSSKTAELGLWDKSPPQLSLKINFSYK